MTLYQIHTSDGYSGPRLAPSAKAAVAAVMGADATILYNRSSLKTKSIEWFVKTPSGTYLVLTVQS